jgi:hypothetical protein
MIMSRPIDIKFEALRIEGNLFPADWLGRLLGEQLDAQTEKDYGIPPGLKLREEIGRAWRIAEASWREWQAARERGSTRFDVSARYLAPLFRDAFGYADMGNVLISAKVGLDTPDAAFGSESRKKRTPFAALQAQLATGGTRWGIVASPSALRLTRENPSLTRPAYVEADLERIFAEGRFQEFAALWLLIHASRFSRDAEGSTVFDRWLTAARASGERALADLRQGVVTALTELGSGFLIHPANVDLRQRLEAGDLSDRQYFAELLRLIYRLIFLAALEDREFLFAPDTNEATQARYREGYSFGLLRGWAGARRNGDPRNGDAWALLSITFKALAQGQPALGLPALGGLFGTDQCPDLDAAKLPNSHLLAAVRALAFVQRGNALARVNWRDMDTEEFGGVYESLLELQPSIDPQPTGWRFGFSSVQATGDTAKGKGSAKKGNARKLTGSYYTPHALVQALIRTTLDPVIERTLNQAASARPRVKPTDALLQLKVIDPACGSGHFLLAAARRIAEAIAEAEAEINVGQEPTPAAFRHALRETVRHCIYGTDRNPMALELAKTALWLESIEPGKPLGFLDHHLRCGDSLIGVLDPAILKNGIPDEAYKPLTGDDAEVCKQLKAINAKARKAAEATAARTASSLGLDFGSDAASQALDSLPEDSLDQVIAKTKRFRDLDGKRHHSRLAMEARLFVAAFYATKRANGRVPTTQELNDLRAGKALARELVEAIDATLLNVRPLDWPTEFPEVFPVAPAARRGFDIILGNPPWEVEELKELEFFSHRAPRISQLAGERRKEAIRNLESDDPRVWREYVEAQHRYAAFSQFARNSGRFPLTAVGKLNTYPLFSETAHQLRAVTGAAGLVVPTGIATDDSTKAFFAQVSKEGVASLYDFENREGIFPSVHKSYKFCLLTLANTPKAKFLFFATRIEHLLDERRRFELTPDQIALINPNTRTASVFRSKEDARLSAQIYRSVPVLIRDPSDESAGENPWRIGFRQGLFNMTADSGLFVTTMIGGHLPLYEAKMIHQFDHRWATYAGADAVTANTVSDEENQGDDDEIEDEENVDDKGPPTRNVTLAEKAATNFEVMPRYWIDERHVLARLAAVPGFVTKAWIAEQHRVNGLRIKDARDLAKAMPFVDAMLLWWCGSWLSHHDEGPKTGLQRVQYEARLIRWRGKIDLDGEEFAAALDKQWSECNGQPLPSDRLSEVAALEPAELDEWVQALMDELSPKWLMGWRDIARSTDERTFIASVLPRVAVGHVLPLVFPYACPADLKLAWLGLANSLTLDYVARQKVGGTHLTYGFLKQFAMLPPEAFSPKVLRFVVPRVLELSFTSSSLSSMYDDVVACDPAYDPRPEGGRHRPFSFCEPADRSLLRRALVRAELDAVFAHLYRLRRDDLRFILDPREVMGEDYPSVTFPGLKRNETGNPLIGEYRTRRLVLEAWDRYDREGWPDGGRA